MADKLKPTLVSLDRQVLQSCKQTVKDIAPNGTIITDGSICDQLKSIINRCIG